MRFIAGLASLLTALCLTTVASAHASLVATDPGDGSVVTTAPKMMQLRFNEAVTPAVINLIDATGRVRGDATVHATGDTILITLPDDLPQGTQLVSYRVISADGHPVAGSVVFSVGAATAAPVIPASSGTVNGLIWLTRIGLYLGLFAGVGGAFFAAWIGRTRAGAGLIGLALAIGLLSAIASLGLQGLDALGLALQDIVFPLPWTTALGTSLAASLSIAVVAMAAGIVAMQSTSVTVARALSALALAGVGLSLAASGHAASAPPQWLTRPLVFLHGVGVAFWLGALAPLAVMVWRPAEPLLPALHRFSRLALPVVGALVLAGLVLAIVQMESFGSLIETRYGIILSIKVVLVMVLLGLAALNRFRLTPALARVPKESRPLLRSILIECLVAGAILADVAGWRFTPPPRALAAAIQAPLGIHIHSEKAMFQVLISPAEVGLDSFVLQLMNGDATPLAAKEATLTLSLPERGIEGLDRSATLGPDGYWHVRGVPLPFAGRWHLRITALVTDFESITLEDDFDVPTR
jgi:copper transport protein